MTFYVIDVEKSLNPLLTNTLIPIDRHLLDNFLQKQTLPHVIQPQMAPSKTLPQAFLWPMALGLDGLLTVFATSNSTH